MKKVLKIILPIVCVCCLLAGLTWWQRNNLAALRLALLKPQEEIAAELDETHQQVSQAAEKATGHTIRKITAEEQQALKDNTLSREELIEMLLEPQEAEPLPAPEPVKTPASPESPVPTQKPQPSKPQKPEPQKPPLSPEAADRRQLAAYLAELTVMQVEYTTWLEDTHQAAIDEFIALPKEQQTSAKKHAIGLAYMQLGLEKEKECDALVAALEGKIAAILDRLGESHDLVDEIHATYLNEKALKKAYYLSLH